MGQKLPSPSKQRRPSIDNRQINPVRCNNRGSAAELELPETVIPQLFLSVLFPKTETQLREGRYYTLIPAQYPLSGEKSNADIPGANMYFGIYIEKVCQKAKKEIGVS